MYLFFMKDKITPLILDSKAYELHERHQKHISHSQGSTNTSLSAAYGNKETELVSCMTTNDSLQEHLDPLEIYLELPRNLSA